MSQLMLHGMIRTIFALQVFDPASNTCIAKSRVFVQVDSFKRPVVSYTCGKNCPLLHTLKRTLSCAKNRRCESSCVTSPLVEKCDGQPD